MQSTCVNATVHKLGERALQIIPPLFLKQAVRRTMSPLRMIALIRCGPNSAAVGYHVERNPQERPVRAIEESARQLEVYAPSSAARNAETNTTRARASGGRCQKAQGSKDRQRKHKEPAMPRMGLFHRL